MRRPPLVWNVDGFEDCLADAYLELGGLLKRFPKRAWLSINPSYPLAHYYLSQAYERKGEVSEPVWNTSDSCRFGDAGRDLQEVIVATQRLAAGT